MAAPNMPVSQISQRASGTAITFHRHGRHDLPLRGWIFQWRLCGAQNGQRNVDFSIGNI